MSYTPPNGLVTNASWHEAPVYGLPFGKASANWSGGITVSPVGLPAPGTPSPRLLWTEFVTPTGFDHSVVQARSATTDEQYPAPQHFVNASWFWADSYSGSYFKVPGLWGKTVMVYAAGIGTPAVPLPRLLWTEFARPAGIDALRVGRHFTLHDFEYAWPEWRVDASWLGAEDYGGKTSPLDGWWVIPIEASYLGVVGSEFTVFGSTAIRHTLRRVEVPGIAAPQAGNNLTVWLKTRWVFAGVGAPSLRFGNETTIWNRNQYVTPGGLASELFGTAFVQGGEKNLNVSGHDSHVFGNPPWVSRSPRLLAPAGMFEETAQTHRVSFFTRTLAPEGFEATRWGTRIIPEGQTIYPEGFAEAWGEATVWNLRQIAAPLSIGYLPDEEYQRFGWQWVWNLRQIIAPWHEVDDGLSGNFPARWTHIENRDRVITHHSTAPPRMGRPLVELGARALLAKSIAAPSLAVPQDAQPTLGKAMVAYRVRYITRLDPIEPVPIMRWHIVWNAAKPLKPVGEVHTLFGTAEVVNTRRYYRLVGWQNDEFGKPFIADRIRTLKVERRFTIAPPVITYRHEVKLHTRYVEPRGWDSYRTGGHYLQIHWTIITPRWNLQHFFGYPTLRNLTPELPVFGHDSQEFGDTHLRTQWRRVETRETFTQLFGKPIVEYRTKKVFAHGFPTLFFSERNRVICIGPEPVVTQYLRPYGIPPISERFGKPYMNYRFLLVHSDNDDFMVFGEADLRAMSVYPSPGIPAPWPGVPRVGLKNRRVYAEGWHSNDPYEIPISSHDDPNRLRVSPHTIYAPGSEEATEQARRNHTPNNPHVINYWDKWRFGNPGFGRPEVTNQYRAIFAQGHQDSRFGASPAEVVNKTHAVRPEGFRNFRGGVHRVIGAQTRWIDLDEEGFSLGSRPGKPTLHIDTTGWSQRVQPPSLDDTLWGQTEVQNQHREVHPHGFYSLHMGHSREDHPYQWQSLHVGPPVATIPAGWDSADSGEAWISHRVRGVEVEGFDASEIDYEFSNFQGRMRVRRYLPAIPQQRLGVFGMNHEQHASPCVHNVNHHILPDGNAEVYRKGAPNQAAPLPIPTPDPNRPPPQVIGAVGFVDTGFGG